MYIIERPTLTDAMILAGSLAEPSPAETEWVSGGTYTVGLERTRSSLHRVYRCAVPRSPSSTPTSATAPEADPTGWVEVRPTDRWVPMGAYVNAAGQTIYRGLAVESTTADLTWRLQLRYCNALALFGLRGARVRVQVYSTVGGTLVEERVVTLKRPATGYWDYAYGEKLTSDRVLITDLPIYPAAEVVITVEGSVDQLRRITHLEFGKLRYLPGVKWGGVEYGVTSTVRVRLFRQQDEDGTEAVLIYGTSQDLQGVVALHTDRENAVLGLLRRLVGKGVAVLPTLLTDAEQRLTYGVIDVAPMKRDSTKTASVDISVRGLPVD